MNRHKRKKVLAIIAALAFEVGSLWLKARRLGGNVVVRCRHGHLFTTLWIPAVSVKAIRLGPWRIQRCPVGHHWTLVTPVRDSDLTEDERKLAREHRDVRLP